jgi:FkbM family methyltransferase
MFVPAYFLYKRWHEDPFWNLARRNPELFNDGDILDIGANIGYTCWVFAQAVRAGAKVYAFEPDRASYVLLEEIIRKKRLAEMVQVISSSVGRTEGFLEFWHNPQHSADHRVVTETFKTHCTAIDTSRVPVTSVDVFVANLGLKSISFVKIDVQGYELAVCEGMESTLNSFPQMCVCFEYDPQAMSQLGFEPQKLIDFFRSRGYQLYILNRRDIQSASDDASIQGAVAKSGYVDILCSKSLLFG